MRTAWYCSSGPLPSFLLGVMMFRPYDRGVYKIAIDIISALARSQVCGRATVAGKQKALAHNLGGRRGEEAALQTADECKRARTCFIQGRYIAGGASLAVQSMTALCYTVRVCTRCEQCWQTTGSSAGVTLNITVSRRSRHSSTTQGAASWHASQSGAQEPRAARAAPNCNNRQNPLPPPPHLFGM